MRTVGVVLLGLLLVALVLYMAGLGLAGTGFRSASKEQAYGSDSSEVGNEVPASPRARALLALGAGLIFLAFAVLIVGIYAAFMAR